MSEKVIIYMLIPLCEYDRFHKGEVVSYCKIGQTSVHRYSDDYIEALYNRTNKTYFPEMMISVGYILSDKNNSYGDGYVRKKLLENSNQSTMILSSQFCIKNNERKNHNPIIVNPGNEFVYNITKSDLENLKDKLYNMIIGGRMFVNGNKIYVVGRDGSVNPMTASLKTFLTSIGKLTLKEFERGEKRYVGFDTIERTLHNDPDYECSDELYNQSISASSLGVEASVELSINPFADDEKKDALVRSIVNNMESPCKEIFTFTYFRENGKKMKGDDIAKQMGYSSADVVKNQRTRCKKKFQQKFEAELAKLQ